MVICNINKEKFKNFMQTVEMKKENFEFHENTVASYDITIGNNRVTIHLVSFNYDNGNGGFVGGNWDDLKNDLFKTNK